MIDFTKVKIVNTECSVLENNLLLDFCYSINPNTGVIRTFNKQGKKITPYKNAYYNGLEFRIYDSGAITLEGSLHKYFNFGKHNYNNFTKENLIEVLTDIENKFNINLKNCILRCIEIGVNIIPPINTKHIIENCYFHNQNKFDTIYNSDEGNYKQCRYQQYIVKLYDKAKHYINKGCKIEDQILRFEIKYCKMIKVNKIGIENLEDLQNIDFEIFKPHLLKEWANIFFYENPIQISPLNKILRKQVLNYSNQAYWENLKSKNRQYHLNEFRKYIVQYTEQTQNKIYTIIQKKIDQLNTIV